MQQLPPSLLDHTLLGRAIMYNFDGAGWCVGVVEEELDDDGEVDEETEQRANFLV